MARLPWYKMFPLDMLGDPKLNACDPASRDAWTRLYNSMRVSNEYWITGSRESLSRTCACTVSQMEDAIRDLAKHGVPYIVEGFYDDLPAEMRALSPKCPLDVPLNVPALSPSMSPLCPLPFPAVVTLVSRKIWREHVDRKLATDRKKKQREKKRAQRVTQESRESPSKVTGRSQKSEVITNTFSSENGEVSHGEKQPPKTEFKAAEFVRIWERVANKPAGAALDWQRVTETTIRAAELKGKDPHEFAASLVGAFLELRKFWIDRKSPYPQADLNGFENNFARSLEWLEGVRPVVERNSRSRTDEPPRPTIRSVTEMRAEREALERGE